MSHDTKILCSIFLLLLQYQFQFCTPTDTINNTQSLKDGDLLISSNQTFALGFFTPGKSTNWYLGMWYHKVSEQTVVWVANRGDPINDTSGSLSFDVTGNLVVTGPDRSNPIWSTNVSDPTLAKNSSAQLLDSGNLVVLDSNGVVVWQSFDYPTNTLLPNFRFGVNRKTGLNRFVTSWKSGDDPEPGEYSLKMDLNGAPQPFLYKGSELVWRVGSWIGREWSGVPEMKMDYFNHSYVENQDEVSMTYSILDPSISVRMVLNEFGTLQRLTWNDNEHRWVEIYTGPKKPCDSYNYCGTNGYCDPSNLVKGQFECTCLPGFEPKSAHDWYLRDGSGGCVRKRGWHVCGGGGGFEKVPFAKVPNPWTAHVDRGVKGLKECESECLRNCSCNAYASADVSRGDSGCVTWHGDLMDSRVFTSGGQDLYIRVDAVELAQYLKSQQHSHGKKQGMVAAIAASVTAVSLLAFCLICWLVVKKRRGIREQQHLLFSPDTTTSLEASSMGKHFDESGTNPELSYFDLSIIVSATGNFSLDNKLGEGGFGTVYKGRLPNGQEIAVKRLAKNSGQGAEEFKTEVTLIAKLQHRNLVRLLGYCIQKDEKVLIYEYLPNKGLNSFIFDRTKGSSIDWKMRFNIVLGIARGLLYLHQDSRLRIIHRDLKASNVLLDAEMNPKISDFGMAKIFGKDQIEANTNRVVGTYGYMSPEYAMEGLFSVKSDVFSFGVLLLEIITGRKNSSYIQDNSVNLIGHVWSLWQEGRAVEIVRSWMTESDSDKEVLRCIHIALLCVEESANDRPNMSEVAFMLCNETALPPPKQPAFIFKGADNRPDTSSSARAGAVSINDVTLSAIQAR
ncbi:G-type lectin S-receptor-like serine/threonine-protein kinase RKS1 isoform X1 [Rhododendron vialii]|uniref:G-type lectin S-receptor-like serine/threonine-protein kinase RKS1 isoform X1 n=1 Tax=Rhododendron vialii TaxID=182163 RepID=UPI00265F4A50|nr:G-type lectin S-receptor-like serine/threonine-protein kinase RKS1 isoform X1 [Rhododendron vialii]XP_058197192.1 G-type lectin S-receptor-like serine/threonine-protein kinase RKS1 isoform X1 [Rhododendron vialii]